VNRTNEDGPAADPAGNIFLESGNGNFDGPNNVFGDTVIKLSTTNGLAVADYFTPYNEIDLNLRDIDIGSAGQIVLPDSVGSVAHPHLLIAGSKAGPFYVLRGAVLPRRKRSSHSLSFIRSRVCRRYFSMHRVTSAMASSSCKRKGWPGAVIFSRERPTLCIGHRWVQIWRRTTFSI
jgi:hypothetical protein